MNVAALMCDSCGALVDGAACAGWKKEWNPERYVMEDRCPRCVHLRAMEALAARMEAAAAAVGSVAETLEATRALLEAGRRERE